VGSFYFYTMSAAHPIGVFDSGVGGTSIWQEIHSLLPHENTLYLADSKNAPYGNKTQEEIIALSIKNTEWLLQHQCKIIVVACNTATTNAIKVLRSRYSVPFIGIEPAIKPAALQTKTKSIGILATKGTLSSDLFYKTTKEHANDVKITEIIGEGLVPLIEKGQFNSPEMTKLLNKYTQPMIAAQIDCLVLGCSHYPYLIPLLKNMLPETIKIIDSGEAVARQTKSILERNHLLNTAMEKPALDFYSNLDTNTLAYLLKGYSTKIRINKINF